MDEFSSEWELTSETKPYIAIAVTRMPYLTQRSFGFEMMQFLSVMRRLILSFRGEFVTALRSLGNVMLEL